jgi:hypothetical protein
MNVIATVNTLEFPLVSLIVHLYCPAPDIPEVLPIVTVEVVAPEVMFPPPDTLDQR